MVCCTQLWSCQEVLIALQGYQLRSSQSPCKGLNAYSVVSTQACVPGRSRILELHCRSKQFVIQSDCKKSAAKVTECCSGASQPANTPDQAPLSRQHDRLTNVPLGSCPDLTLNCPITPLLPGSVMPGNSHAAASVQQGMLCSCERQRTC